MYVNLVTQIVAATKNTKPKIVDASTDRVGTVHVIYHSSQFYTIFNYIENPNT